MTDDILETTKYWLNDDFINKILTSYENQEVELVKYEKELATKKGENFVGILYRLRIEYCLGSNGQLKTLSAIVKSQQNRELFDAIENEFNIFERESQVYKVIMDECEKVLDGIGDKTRFGPRALYIDERVIVLEDLKSQGYGMMDVRKGLDKEYCSRILEKLAKFHAAARVVYDKQPELFKHHMNGNVSENPNPLHAIYENTIQTCIEYVMSKDDLAMYTDKLKAFGSDVVKKMINVFKRDPNKGFVTLNHGDMWVNNFMFKKDTSGKLQDVLFVDYQEGFFGSPGIDFNYLIYTSMTDDVYRCDLDNLIKLYFNNLEQTLFRLGSKNIPTFEMIKNEIRSKSDHGVVTACCLYPILATDHLELTDPEIIVMDDEESHKKRLIVFDSENYHRKLKLVLPDFVKEKFI